MTPIIVRYIKILKDKTLKRHKALLEYLTLTELRTEEAVISKLS